MTLNIVKRDKAKHDLIDLADYLARDDIEVAERFIDAAENAFHFLSGTPGAGALREYDSPTLSELRMWPIRDFEKHLIFYRQTSDSIEIVPVIHSARDIEAIFGEAEIP